MYNNLKDIVNVFRTDEALVRLLTYPPKNAIENVKDPLDETLPDIIPTDEFFENRDKRILLVPKSDDLVTEPLCRIYLYAGRREPTGNYHVAKQQVIVDILCHSDFEKDLRSMRISDRVNDLLVHERVTGIGKMDYGNGNQIGAPSNYVGYRHVYEFGSTKR